MGNTKYIKLEIRAEDYPYIAEAFAYAVAFFSMTKLEIQKNKAKKEQKI